MVLDGFPESGEYPKNDRFGLCQAPLRRPREHIAFGMYSQGGEEVERLDRRSKHQDSSYDGREAFWQKQSLLRRIKSPEDCKGSRGRSRVLTWNPVNEIQIALVLRERREQRDKTALMGKPYNTG